MQEAFSENVLVRPGDRQAERIVMANRPIGSGLPKKMDGRRKKIIMELVYIVIAVLITGLAVVAFFYQEKVSFLYPVIFLLGAVINALTGYRYMQRDHNNKRHKLSGIFAFVIAAALVIMAVIGIIVIL